MPQNYLIVDAVVLVLIAIALITLKFVPEFKAPLNGVLMTYLPYMVFEKWQYMLGGAMPTLTLGAGTAVIAVATSQWLLFLIAELMIFSGGGDFLIILKILLYRFRRKETMKSRYISILKDFRTFPNE